MKHARSSLAVLFIALALTLCSPALAQTPPAALASKQLQQELVAITRQVVPSVVAVRSFVRRSAATEGGAPSPASVSATAKASGWIAAGGSEDGYPGFEPHRAGSGFFIGVDGDVLTDLHALTIAPDRLADLIEIETHDGQRILADVLGIEPTLHLAVLRAAVFPSWTRPAMRPLPLADSDATELGQLLLAFGDPSGPERFIGSGLLVAKPSRDCYQELLSATYMQATLSVPTGAIGGPLVDLDGNVVGILGTLDVGIVSAGSAWALPSKLLRGLYESIRDAGTMQSPWLGISVMSRAEIATARGLKEFQAMAKPRHGIMIENVFAPSPAYAAGVLPGDFLTHFGGVEIHAPVDFQRQLYLAGVGAAVKLTFCRGTEPFERTLTIDKRPAAAAPR